MNSKIYYIILSVLIPIGMQFTYIRYISYNVDKEIYGNFILIQIIAVLFYTVFMTIPIKAYERFYNSSLDKFLYLNEFKTLAHFINIISAIILFIYWKISLKFSFEDIVILIYYISYTNLFLFTQKYFLLNMSYKDYFYNKILESSVKFVIPLIFYVYFQTLTSFLFGLTIGYVVLYYVTTISLREYKYNFIFIKDNFFKYIRFAYPVLFVSAFGWGISFSDRYFIEYYQGTEKVAIYALLAQTAGFSQIFAQLFNISFYPKILKEYEVDKVESIRILNRIISYTIFLFLLIIVLVLLLPKSIFTILLEPQMLNTHYYTFIFLIAGVLLTVLQSAHSLHLVLMNKISIMAYIQMFGLLINLIGNVFIHKYGLLAAALSTLVSYFAMILIQFIYIKTRLF